MKKIILLIMPLLIFASEKDIEYEASLFINSEFERMGGIYEGICWTNIVSYKKDSLITYSKYLFKDVKYIFYTYAIGGKVMVLIEDPRSKRIYKISKLGNKITFIFIVDKDGYYNYWIKGYGDGLQISYFTFTLDGTNQSKKAYENVWRIGEKNEGKK